VLIGRRVRIFSNPAAVGLSGMSASVNRHAGLNGSSMPSVRSSGHRPCWPICRAIPSASPSLTVAIGALIVGEESLRHHEMEMLLGPRHWLADRPRHRQDAAFLTIRYRPDVDDVNDGAEALRPNLESPEASVCAAHVPG
jgi:hypothetical protein